MRSQRIGRRFESALLHHGEFQEFSFQRSPLGQAYVGE